LIVMAKDAAIRSRVIDHTESKPSRERLPDL
jgi:hypothetical protein